MGEKPEHYGSGRPKITDEDILPYLKLLDRGEVKQYQVAEELGVTPASLSTRLKLLRGGSLKERVADLEESLTQLQKVVHELDVTAKLQAKILANYNLIKPLTLAPVGQL